jgi:hypothetical protein
MSVIQCNNEGSMNCYKLGTFNKRNKTVNTHQTHQILLSKFRRHVSTLYGHLQALLWNKTCSKEGPEGRNMSPELR